MRACTHVTRMLVHVGLAHATHSREHVTCMQGARDAWVDEIWDGREILLGSVKISGFGFVRTCDTSPPYFEDEEFYGEVVGT